MPEPATVSMPKPALRLCARNWPPPSVCANLLFIRHAAPVHHMPVRVSEAFTLRTYPYREADLIVAAFTRDQGMLRGIVRRARRPKSGFGAGFERLSQVRLTYYQRENTELVRLDGCEMIQSQFDLAKDYAAGVALDFLADISGQLLPPAEPNEKFFRLLAAVLAHLRANPETGMWTAVTYFSLWAVRLQGFLPDLHVSAESNKIAQEMLTTPIAQLSPSHWTRDTARDLRRALVRVIEHQIDRKLITAPHLESL